MVRNGANVNAKNKWDEAVVCLAAKTVDLKLVKYLIKKGAEVDPKNVKEIKPLHVAVKYNHLLVMKYLIKNGANVSAINEYYKESALHIALRNRNLELAEYLIASRANVNAINDEGENPLCLAIQNGSLEIVNLLVQKGANVHEVIVCKKTPLHFAAAGGYLDTVKFLIANGADVCAKISEDNTIFERAVEDEKIHLVQPFIWAMRLKSLKMERPTCLSQNSALSEYWQSCGKEIEGLYKINPLFLEILRESDGNRLEKLCLNSAMMHEAFKEHFTKNYPIYASLIQHKFNKRRDINFIFDALKKSDNLPYTLRQHLQLASQEERTYNADDLELSLPNEVLEKILYVLNVKELERVFKRD